jgi:integrase
MNSLIANNLLHAWKNRYARATTYQWRNIFKRLLLILQEFGAPRIQLDRVPTPRAKTRTATPDELRRLLAAAGAHMRLFVLLTWKLGLRHTAAFQVSPSTYDREHATILIHTKNDKRRTIPVTPDIAALLNAASDHAGDLTESAVSILRRGGEGKPLSPTSMQGAWHRLCKKAEVYNLTPHDLRRTVANLVMQKTHDIRAVQAYLGHDNLASTCHYIAPLTEESLRDLQTLLNFHSEVKN